MDSVRMAPPVVLGVVEPCCQGTEWALKVIDVTPVTLLCGHPYGGPPDGAPSPFWGSPSTGGLVVALSDHLGSQASLYSTCLSPEAGLEMHSLPFCPQLTLTTLSHKSFPHGLRWLKKLLPESSDPFMMLKLSIQSCTSHLPRPALDLPVPSWLGEVMHEAWHPGGPG